MKSPYLPLAGSWPTHFSSVMTSARQPESAIGAMAPNRALTYRLGFRPGWT